MGWGVLISQFVVTESGQIEFGQALVASFVVLQQDSVNARLRAIRGLGNASFFGFGIERLLLCFLDGVWRAEQPLEKEAEQRNQNLEDDGHYAAGFTADATSAPRASTSLSAAATTAVAATLPVMEAGSAVYAI